jgi:hypothetical protein
VNVPRWSSSDAAADLADVAVGRIIALGSDITAAARQMAGAAYDYEAADERATGRLRTVR